MTQLCVFLQPTAIEEWVRAWPTVRRDPGSNPSAGENYFGGRGGVCGRGALGVGVLGVQDYEMLNDRRILLFLYKKRKRPFSKNADFRIVLMLTEFLMVIAIFFIFLICKFVKWHYFILIKRALMSNYFELVNEWRYKCLAFKEAAMMSSEDFFTFGTFDSFLAGLVRNQVHGACCCSTLKVS